MQTSLLGIALSLILAFLAALIGPAFIDWNARKPWIEAEASRLFAMPVKLNGAVTLKLLPIPTLELEDVTIGDAARSVSIGGLYGELRLAPLLRGHIVMEKTAFERPVLRVALRGDGAETGTSLPNIDDLAILDGTVVITDALGGETRFSGLNLLGESTTAGLKLSGKASIAGEPAQVALIFTTARSNDKARLRLKLEGRQGTIEADGIWDSAAALPFDGQFTLNQQGPLGQLHYRAPLAASPLRFVMEPGEGDISREGVILRFTGQGEIDRAAARFSLGFQARALDVDALTRPATAWPQVLRLQEAVAGLAASPLLPMQGEIRSEVNQIRLGGAAYDQVVLHLLRQEGRWSLGLLQARLPGEGSIALEQDVAKLRLKTPDAGSADQWSGHLRLDLVRPHVFARSLVSRAVPPSAIDPMTLEAKVAASSQQMLLSDMLLQTRGGALRGRLGVEHVLSLPVVRADVAAGEIDLEALATSLGGLESVAGTPLDISLTAERARYGLFELGQLRLSALRTETMLALRSLELASSQGEIGVSGTLILSPAMQGRLDGRVNLAATPGAWRDRLLGTLTLPDRARAIIAAAGPVIVTGRADIAAGVTKITAEGLLGDGPVRLQTETAAAGYPRKVEASWSRPDMGAVLALFGLGDVTARGPQATLTMAVSAASATQQTLRFQLQHPSLDLLLQGQGDPASGSEGSLMLRSDDLAPVASATGFLSEEITETLPLDWQGTWRQSAQRIEMTGRGQFARQPVVFALTQQDGGTQAVLRASALDAHALGAFLLAPRLRSMATGPLSLDIGVEAMTLLDTRMRDLSLIMSGTAERWQFDLKSLRFDNDERVTGTAQLVPLSGGAALSGSLLLADAGLATFWPGAAGDMQARVTFAGQGGDVAKLGTSLLGTVAVTGRGWSLPGLNPRAFQRTRRAAEEAHDLGRPMDEGRLARIFRDEAARPTLLGDLQISGTLNAGLLRLPLPPLSPEGGKVTGQIGFDLARTILRFEGAIQADGDILPRIPVTIESTQASLRSQYGLDDTFGWLTLLLLDREENRIDMSEADRMERLRQRLRLDRQARPRSPVRSLDRFIAPRP